MSGLVRKIIPQSQSISMKRNLFWSALAGVLMFSFLSDSFATSRYVDGSAIGANNGTDWANAYVSLEDAVADAHNDPTIDTILVAQGTYFPSTIAGAGSNPRDRTFLFTRDGLAVLGGYPSGGGVRDIVNNLTVLNGDLDVIGDNADNALHIMVAVGTITQALDSTLVIDGFTFINGNANISSGNIINGMNAARSNGGAIYTYYSGIKISNCTFKYNNAEYGGAIFAKESIAIISNCSFKYNNASLNGGALDNVNSGLKINNASFTDNTANTGGAIAFHSSTFTPQVLNTIFAGNEVSGWGGAIYNNESSPEFINCLFYGNKAVAGGALGNYLNAAPVFINTTIAGNYGTNSGGAMYSSTDVEAVLMNCIVYDNSSGIDNDASSSYSHFYSLVQGNLSTSNGNLNGFTNDPLFETSPSFLTAPFSSGGDYHLENSSPCINSGDNNSVPVDLLFDLAGNDRITENIVDMGPYEKMVSTSCNLIISHNQTNVSCFNESTGVIEITVTGGASPYQYALNGGSYTTNNVFNGLTAGTYVITIMDGTGCMDEIEVIVTQPTALQSTATITQLACFGATNGAIVVSVSGGTEPYNYLWSNGATISEINNLATGTYTLITTDERDCQLYDTFHIENSGDTLIIDIGPDRTLCAHQSATLTVDMEIEDLIYSWTSENGFSSNEVQVTVSNPGTYYVTVTTPEGCTAKDSITISISEGTVSSDFIVTTQGFLDSVITLVNITDPQPDSIQWLLPTSCTIISKQPSYAEISFADTGIYDVGMRAYMGECYEDKISQVIIVEASLNEMPDVPRYPFIKKYVAFPNPSNGNFSVEIELQKEADVNLTLINATTGSLANMRQETISKKATIQYNLSLDTGTYILLLETPYGFRSIKIEIL